MKFLVFGAGVLGCNLANNLFRAGKDVTLLARGPWADEIRRNGLRIKNTLSRRTAVNPIPVAAELLPGDDYDVIFVAVRYTQIETILETLRASLAKTMIFVGNNVRASETAALGASAAFRRHGPNVFGFALMTGPHFLRIRPGEQPTGVPVRQPYRHDSRPAERTAAGRSARKREKKNRHAARNTICPEPPRPPNFRGRRSSAPQRRNEKTGRYGYQGKVFRLATGTGRKTPVLRQEAQAGLPVGKPEPTTTPAAP